MKKTMLLLMISGFLIKILGFIKEIVLANYYGASNISDAYLISLTIPTVIFSFLGVAISTTYIPMYNKLVSEDGEQAAHNFTSDLVNVLFLVTSIIVVIVVLFTNPIVKIFASGFTGDTLELAIELTNLSIFSIYFLAMGNVFIPFLQVNNKFIIPSLIGIPLNLALIFSIIVSSYFGTKILACGKILGVMLQFIMLVPLIYKIGYKHKFRFKIRDKHVIQAMMLALPVMLGTSVNQINVLVDRTIASQVATGGISILNYANRVNLLVNSILILPIITVIYPRISKQVSENNMVGVIENIKSSFNLIFLLVLPVSIGLFIFSEPIVSLLFSRGAFDMSAELMTSQSLFFYSFGIVGVNMREIISRVFYAMQDTKTPMINATIGVVINIVLNIILSKFLGIGGLALATSISAIITTILLSYGLHKKIGDFGRKQLTSSFLKIITASIVMGIISKISYTYLSKIIIQNYSLIISIALGAISYFLIIYFMKIEDADKIFALVRKKIKVFKF